MNFSKKFLGGDIKVKESNDGHNIFFYHYTSRRAADIISRDGRIRNEGNGVLLTTMAPERYYRNEILYNIYGDNTSHHLKNRADYCVRVLSSKLDRKKLTQKGLCSESFIYLYDDDIRVKELDVFDKPTCHRSPQNIQSDVQQSTSSLSSKSGQKPIQMKPDLAFGKSKCREMKEDVQQINMNEINVNLRSDVKLRQRNMPEYQDENVTIYAFEWMKKAFSMLQESIDKEIIVNFEHIVKHRILSDDFSLKDLQIVSRNESSNTNGVINFGNYNGISKEVIYSLKDLNRQTVIIGKDRTTNYGGYPSENIRVPQNVSVYVCDLIGLQFQQQYNSGRLVLVGEHLPKGLLDDFIYEQVVKEKKATMEKVRSDCTGRFVECCGVFFDSKAYVKFVANDVLLYGMALNQCATEPLNFKFLKYGTGYFAGPFRDLLDRFIGKGVAEGLENLLSRLPESHHIKRIELPFFDPYHPIDLVCLKYNVEIKYSKDDALKNTRWGYTTATTNSADPHSMTGNKMGFGSIDGAIAENLSGKAIKFSPIINKLMKECFVQT